MRIAPYVKINVNRAWAQMMSEDGKCLWGRFKNLPHIKPGRWGWWFVLFGRVVVEIGSRNPQDRVGVFLKNRGWWPW